LLIVGVVSFEGRGLALENQQSDALQSSIHAAHQRQWLAKALNAID
jgi:hypothetical protein